LSNAESPGAAAAEASRVPAGDDRRYVVDAGEVALSGRDLADFLSAVVDQHRSFRFAARGNSMHPFIRDSDVVTVAPCDGAPSAGRVVAFRDRMNDRLVIHRIVLAWADGCLVRGDNAAAPDGIVATTDILGIVAGVERQERPVRFGLGFERHLVAALSARGLLVPLVSLVRHVRDKACGRGNDEAAAGSGSTS